MKTNDQLIAEFMGLQVYQTEDEMRAVPLEKLTQWILPEQAEYSHNWSWLMPVIEKIAKTPCVYQPGGEMDPDDTYYPRTFGMIGESGYFMVRFNRHQLFMGKTLVEAAYEAVCDFIEGYSTTGNGASPTA